MSTAKEIVLENINKISNDLDEMEIVERLYMLFRLEHSKKRCKEEGTILQNNGKRKHQYEIGWSPDAMVDLDAAGIAEGELRQQVKSLRKNPEKGTVIYEIGNEHFREINYKKCNIVYEITETMVLVHEIYERPCVFNRSLNKLACTELCEKKTFAETD
ncbi:MAG: hypothetical protein HDT41_04435 [Lachnospiraceae bacterium]|nr:hypothetical protein [Lachnospiraceae bacterium]